MERNPKRSSSFSAENIKRRRLASTSVSDNTMQQVCLYARFLQYKLLESKVDKHLADIRDKITDELHLGELALKENEKNNENTTIPADIKDCFLQIIETLYLFDGIQDEYQFDEFLNRLKTLLININTTLNKESMMDAENEGIKILTLCKDQIQHVMEQDV